MPRTIPELLQIAKNYNWKLNPDEKIVKNVLNGMNNNEKKFGKLYCPCRIKKIEDNICPCIHARQNGEIEQNGICHCNLFLKN